VVKLVVLRGRVPGTMFRGAEGKKVGGLKERRSEKERCQPPGRCEIIKKTVLGVSTGFGEREEVPLEGTQTTGLQMRTESEHKR